VSISRKFILLEDCANLGYPQSAVSPEAEAVRKGPGSTADGRLDYNAEVRENKELYTASTTG